MATPQLVANCPRCGAQRITFDVLALHSLGIQYTWQNHWEAFCRCGNCVKGSIFHLSQSDPASEIALRNAGGLFNLSGSLNRYVTVERHVSISDSATISPPEFLPQEVLAAFSEGAKCMAVGCHNAAGTMFRLCVDITSRSKLPEGDADGLNARVRRDLGLRLPWLFDNRYLPEDLRDLSTCIKEDGNDGAHRGTLTKEDALDLLDFTEALLKRVYTEPERLRLAKERRDARRAA